MRLRIPKGTLAKFDRPNWSEQIYTFTSVTQQTQNNLNNAAAKQARYRTTPIGSTVESDIRYAKESLLAIPPTVAPLGPVNLPAYVIRQPVVLPGFAIAPPNNPGINLNFLQNLWANINGGNPVAPVVAPVIPGYQVNQANN